MSNLIFKIISILLGFCIGYSFQNLYYNFFKFNIIEHGPDSNEIKKQTFKYKNNLYFYKPVPVICPTYQNKFNSENNFFSHFFDIFNILYKNLENLFNNIITNIKNLIENR